MRSGEARWRPSVVPDHLIAVAGAVVAVYLLSQPARLRARAALIERRKWLSEL